MFGRAMLPQRSQCGISETIRQFSSSISGVKYPAGQMVPMHLPEHCMKCIEP